MAVHPTAIVDASATLADGVEVGPWCTVGPNVSPNEPYFPGHFPIDPVMPGVMIIEAMAQTGALMMSKTMDVSVEGKIIMFMSIDGVRFRKPARPGDQLRMKVVVTKQRGDIFKFRGETFIDGKLAAEADFAAMMVTVDPPAA